MAKITPGIATFVTLLSGMTASVVAQQSAPLPWSERGGMSPWPMGPGMMGVE